MRSIVAFAGLSVLFGSVGCAVSSAHSPEDESDGDEVTSELSSTKESFVVLRRDMRKCMAPLCGGYWVRDANRKTAEQYVSGLDFGDTGLGDRVAAAPEGDLILAGKLGKKDAKFGTKTFVVSAAYRALPGVVAADGEALYAAHDRDPAITCIAAPCNNEIGQKINSTAKAFDFTRLSVDRAALPFVDAAWLSSRVLRHGALVAAKVVRGAKMAGGYEKVLDASQVWVRLPDMVGPCPKIAVRLCEDGTVSTYTRTADRCLMQGECVTPGICPMFMPACPEGYTLASWKSGASACNAYACDPTFVTE